MRKKHIILILIPVIVILLFIIYTQRAVPYKEITDPNTAVDYLQIGEEMYTMIGFESVKKREFTEETYDRMSYEISLTEYDSIKDDPEIEILKGHIGKLEVDDNKIGYKQISKDVRLYFRIVFDHQIASYYAKEGFSLPELKSKNIEKISCAVIHDEAPHKEINDINEIRKILSSPYDYFNENQLVGVWIKYKGYDFEEWFDAEKIDKYANEVI